VAGWVLTASLTELPSEFKALFALRELPASLKLFNILYPAQTCSNFLPHIAIVIQDDCVTKYFS